MSDIVKKYSNGEITIVWKPAMCIHSKKCWTGLPEVFNPREQPWVKPHQVDSDAIIKQIDCCPSKALSYFKDKKE
jgi:uncharacterized Fe-S cluster protein YjdI